MKKRFVVLRNVLLLYQVPILLFQGCLILELFVIVTNVTQ